MGSMELTRDWLQTVAQPYASRERLVQEVIDVLSARRTLAVKTDAYSGSYSLLEQRCEETQESHWQPSTLDRHPCSSCCMAHYPSPSAELHITSPSTYGYRMTTHDRPRLHMLCLQRTWVFVKAKRWSREAGSRKM